MKVLCRLLIYQEIMYGEALLYGYEVHVPSDRFFMSLKPFIKEYVLVSLA